MNTLRIAVPGLLAALVLVGCSDGDKETQEVVERDLCVELGTSCNDETGRIRCDPADGLCKCGGHGGLICPPESVCHLDLDLTPPSPTCVSELCYGAICAPFETCDPLDGVCKCDGVVCGEGRTCLANGCSAEDPCTGVVCPDGQACDPADRICKCGGSVCSVGESCRVGDQGAALCVGRSCVGRNCAEDTACNPVDGLCHCGSIDGDVCTAGQACRFEDGASFCDGHDICDGITCPGNTTCSPLDGKCRCGGYDAVAPVCGTDQTCDLAQTPPRCVGGNACAGVTCPVGTNLSCDGETGDCKCGGTGGVICAAEEGCVDSGGAPTCVTRCDPNRTNVVVEVCGQETEGPFMGCYFSPNDGIAYCTVAGDKAEGAECHGPTDCHSDLHCIMVDEKVGVCRRYCDITVVGDCFNPERSCVALSGRPASLPNLGVCMVVVAAP